MTLTVDFRRQRRLPHFLVEACSMVFALAVVRDFDRRRFRLIAADRYWLSDPFKFWFRWNFQQAQGLEPAEAASLMQSQTTSANASRFIDRIGREVSVALLGNRLLEPHGEMFA